MSSNTETLDKLATPIYQHNANRHYYEKHRNDPDYKAMLNEKFPSVEKRQ